MSRKYNGYTFKEVPTEKFSKAVEISKGDFKRKFINEDRAILWIEEQKTEELIDNQKIKVENELYENGMYFYEDN